MLVRQMTVSDIDSVYEIADKSLGERYVREVFLLFINGWPGGQLIAADDLGNVIGFLSGARLPQDKASIQIFAVDPRRRREGVGSRLLEEFRFRTSMDGRHYIQLEVKEENTGAISFYEKRGFTAIAYLEEFYYDGGSALRMMCSVRGNS
ncbi:MAG: GNAT family N-acetyltransferase [Methanomassiliicoccaceae archaeon]|nr:GNAT family N-acetyltransferase [Methanomassiliicoccaceae archaeon]MCL2145949.1 GNAT family N-acetyltransferase [Methanomassiliicoccaceae archaeon]